MIRSTTESLFAPTHYPGTTGFVKLQLATIASLALALLGQPLLLPRPVFGDDDANLATVSALQQSIEGVIAGAEASVVAVGRRAASSPQSLTAHITDVFGELRAAAPDTNEPTTVAAGVIIDPAGLVLTEYLAVRQGDQHTITTVDGATYNATVKAADPRSALAVLAIDPQSSNPSANSQNVPPSFPALTLGEAERLRKGHFVVAIGNPFAIAVDGQPTASWGTVTNIARKAPAGANLNNAPGPMHDYRTTLHHLGTLLQTDAKLAWNAGGGALVNMRGELVGITTTVATIAGHEQPAGYAVPMNSTVRRVIDTLKQGQEVEYGLLGISFGLAPADSAFVAGQQVAVQQVYPGSPAARAGLAPQDIIETIGGHRVHDIDAIQLAVSALPPGSKTEIGFVRNGREEKTQVTLAKLASPGNAVVTSRLPAWRGIRVDYSTALDSIALAEASNSGAIDDEGCVLVRDVEPESPAWLAGIRPGMFISHVAGQRVTTPSEFSAAVKNVGEKLDLRLTTPRMEDRNH